MLTSPKELENLTGYRFFNFCVDNALAEDYEAIFNWVSSRGGPLKAILLGLDVEALHSDDQLDPRLKSNAELMRALPSRTATSRLPDRLLDILRPVQSIFSYPYAIEMVQSVSAKISNRKPRLLLFDDGTLNNLDYKEQKKNGSFDLQANIRKSMPEYLQRFEGMVSLSPSRLKRVRSLLQKALAMRARVVVWITPIHPTVVRFLDKETHYSELLDATRVFIRQIEMEFGIPVFDFSDITHFSGIEDGWYDGGHVDEVNASLITAHVAAAMK